MATSAFENYFLAAQKLRQRIRTDFDVVFRQPSPLNGFDKTGSSTSGVDCLVHPAAISSAPELHLDGKVRHTAQEYMQDILNVPSSLAGIPAISVPWRDDTEGWPLGIQVAAQWGHEHILFRAARILAER